jgi:hypothetical protein
MSPVKTSVPSRADQRLNSSMKTERPQDLLQRL